MTVGEQEKCRTPHSSIYFFLVTSLGHSVRLEWMKETVPSHQSMGLGVKEVHLHWSENR